MAQMLANTGKFRIYCEMTADWVWLWYIYMFWYIQSNAKPEGLLV